MECLSLSLLGFYNIGKYLVHYQECIGISFNTTQNCSAEKEWFEEYKAAPTKY